MRFNSFPTLLAGLAGLTVAAPLIPALNATTLAVKHNYIGYDPAPNSVAMHLEGLAPCYVRRPSPPPPPACPFSDSSMHD